VGRGCRDSGATRASLRLPRQRCLRQSYERLTRDEFKLLRAFNEQAKGDPRAYLSVEFAAYRAQVGGYDVKLRRLKDLGYLQESNIEAGYLGRRPVWITVEGIRRAESKR
jgi:hypothetical protein